MNLDRVYEIPKDLKIGVASEKESSKVSVEENNKAIALAEQVKMNANANGYRLPTEAEWEYAARGGEHSRHEYAGSNELDEVGWYNGNNGSWILGFIVGNTFPVGQNKANGYGLYDMSGNVFEWCWDKYQSDDLLHKVLSYTNIELKDKVIRGGSWQTISSVCRVDSRRACHANHRNLDLGVRLVRSIH